jgi:hypothetical protein
MRLYRRVDMRECANSTRNGAGGNFGARQFKARAAAGKFGVEAGQLQAKGCRFCMNAVAAPDGGCVAMLLGAQFQASKQPVNACQHQITGPRHLHGKGGVQNIG